MATAWSAATANQGTGAPFDSVNHLPLPAAGTQASVAGMEQYRIAAAAAVMIRRSKVVGEGPLYDVTISGGWANGHPNGDSVSVVVTGRNGPAGSPAAWACPSNGTTITFGKPGHINAPAGNPPREVVEQYNVARAVADYIRGAKVVGEGTQYQVDISGNASPGHTNGDSITVVVTNKN